LDREDEFIFTTPLSTDQLRFAEEIANCPVLVQERIDKVADVRITVVGEEIFPALIRSKREYSSLDVVDFRALPEETIECITVPTGLADLIREMMRQMTLQFAAFDFALTEEKEFIFFEANVAGNWLWIEHATHLPISDAVADFLISVQ